MTFDFFQKGKSHSNFNLTLLPHKFKMENPLAEAQKDSITVMWIASQHVCPVLNMKYGVFERKEGEAGGEAGAIVGRPPGWVLSF